MYVKLTANQLSFHPSLSLESILECVSKSDRIIELLILSFSKYLLNVYYMTGTVLGAGSKMINELDRALALEWFHYTSENSCCTWIYKWKTRFNH